MHEYRTHTCGALRLDDVGQSARLSGWVHRVRDHGGEVAVHRATVVGGGRVVVIHVR